MNEKFGYGLIAKYVAQNPAITADAKAVYMVLCSMADKSGVCNPLVKTIRACTGLSEYRFDKAMQNLRAKGIVTTRQSKEGTTFARNTYQLLDRPYLKISGTAIDEDNPKNLGTGSTGNTQTARTLIDSDAIPSYPTDLGIKQYQCLKIPNDKNNTRKNIYMRLLALLNEAKSKGSSKGRLKIGEDAKIVVERLLEKGYTEDQLIQVAKELAQKGDKYVNWYSFEDYCKQKNRR